MKRIVIIYSIIFLCAGNLPFLHIHHDHENEDSHDSVEHRCIDCLILDSNQLDQINIKIKKIDRKYTSLTLEKQINIFSVDLNNIPPRSPPDLS